MVFIVHPLNKNTYAFCYAADCSKDACTVDSGSCQRKACNNFDGSCSRVACNNYVG